MPPMDEEQSCLWHNGTAEKLTCLNNVKARLYLPVTAFLAGLVVVGTLGNVTVCIVYWKKSSRISSHYFILALAVLDLLTCVLGMPTEIADLSLPYTFDSPMACKVMRFIHSTTIIAGSTLLIQVAFDRYYRICKLGRQFTANKARLLCCSAFVLGIICSWPSIIIFGRKTVPIRLGTETLTGADCSTDDSMRGTIYPTIYYAFLFALFAMTLTFFAVLYTKIGLTILRKKRIGMSRGGSPGPLGITCYIGSWKGKRGTPAPPSSDFSSGQECDQGHSTASSNCSQSSHSQASPNCSLSCHSQHTAFSKCGHSSQCSEEDDSQRSPLGLEDSRGDFGAYMRNTCKNDGREKGPHMTRSYQGQGDTLSEEPIEQKQTLKQSWNTCHADMNQEHYRRSENVRKESNRRKGKLSKESTKHRTSMPTDSNLNTMGPIPHINRTLLTSSTTTLASIMVDSLKHPEIGLQNSFVEPHSPKSPSEKIRAFFFHFQHHSHRQETLITTSGPSNLAKRSSEEQRTPKVFRKHPRSKENEAGTKVLVSRTSTPSGRQIRVGKTTTVLFAVTLAYVLSFLPYLVVMVMRSIIKDLESSLSPTGELAYKFCVKSFFINNAINPLIYSFLNQGFRQDAKNTFVRLCGRNVIRR